MANHTDFGVRSGREQSSHANSIRGDGGEKRSDGGKETNLEETDLPLPQHEGIKKRVDPKGPDPTKCEMHEPRLDQRQAVIKMGRPVYHKRGGPTRDIAADV